MVGCHIPVAVLLSDREVFEFVYHVSVGVISRGLHIYILRNSKFYFKIVAFTPLYYVYEMRGAKLYTELGGARRPRSVHIACRSL